METRTRRPFFIVGMPRSGTTLLQAMLMSLPGLYVVNEAQVMSFVYRHRRKFGDLDDAAGFDRTIAAIRDVCAATELPVDWPALEAELRATPRTHVQLFDTLLFHIQQRRGARRVGDKTPPHLLYVDELLAAFPDAQVITIIRDGRDVAVSQRIFDEPVINVAIRWRLYQRRHFRLAAKYSPGQYTHVRYEDLVLHPQRELERLCAFLDEPFDASVLDYHERTHTGFARRESHKLRTLEPVTGDRIGRYREKLSRNDIAIFQAVAGGCLRQLGYPIEPISPIRGAVLAAAALPGGLLTRRRNQRKMLARALKSADAPTQA